MFDINKMSPVPIKIIYLYKLQYLGVLKISEDFQENILGGVILDCQSVVFSKEGLFFKGIFFRNF